MLLVCFSIVALLPEDSGSIPQEVRHDPSTTSEALHLYCGDHGIDQVVVFTLLTPLEALSSSH